MNVYELNDKATPIPWTVDGGQPSWPSHDNELDGMWSTTTEEANGILAAHCRNNFMKALEALKESHESYIDLLDTTDSGNHSSVLCDTCKLIKELETVKP